MDTKKMKLDKIENWLTLLFRESHAVIRRPWTWIGIEVVTVWS